MLNSGIFQAPRVRAPYIKNRKVEALQRGFTLVEIIVSLSLLLLLSGALNVFLIQGLNTYYINRDRGEVAENLRIGLNRLARELRQATDFDSFTPGQGGRVAFVDLAGDTVSYYISTSGDYESAGQLTRAIRGQGNNPVARYVNRVQVDSVGDDGDDRVVAVTLTGEKGRSGTMELSTVVRLKN